ncbi:hypothetical protein [Methylotenera versatilis]|uniref:hypothetical protein n=1 Tax=Methylotenera versatilis TaxID=1055487 RepID=UPI0009DCDFEB|nr:hypothetical protein [Methylotenera versatilis]
MQLIVYLLAIFVVLTPIGTDAATKTTTIKKNSKFKSKKTTQVVPSYVIEIGYPSVTVAINDIKERKDVVIKPNAKPFGWQHRSGPWYVVNEGPNIEWAFTEGGHYAHPSVIKRIIDVGSSNHVDVDMAFRCGAANSADCDKLLTEFKEVKALISKVYQKKFIKTADGVPVWIGVDNLE